MVIPRLLCEVKVLYRRTNKTQSSMEGSVPVEGGHGRQKVGPIVLSHAEWSGREMDGTGKF